MITSVHPLRKEPVPPLIRVREVAKLLSVSRHTVHSLIQCGDLEAKPVNPSRTKRKRGAGRLHVRVTRESLLKFYKQRFHRSLEHALANPFAA
jgi:hypothetical protein